MICIDHNILFIPFFSAGEAQTLDEILRNDESAVKGMSGTLTHSLSWKIMRIDDILHLQLPLQNSKRPGRVSWLTSALSTLLLLPSPSD